MKDFIKKRKIDNNSLHRYDYKGEIAKPTFTPLSNDGRVKLDFMLSITSIVSTGALVDSANYHTLILYYGEEDPASYSQNFNLPPSLYPKMSDGGFHRVSIELQLKQQNLSITEESGKTLNCSLEYNGDTFSNIQRGNNVITCDFAGKYIYTPITRFTSDTYNSALRKDAYTTRAYLTDHQRWGIRFGYDHPHNFRGWKGECSLKPKLRLKYKNNGVATERVYSDVTRDVVGTTPVEFNVNTYPLVLCGLNVATSEVPCDAHCYINEKNVRFYFKGNQGNTQWYNDADLQYENDGVPPLEIILEPNATNL